MNFGILRERFSALGGACALALLLQACSGGGSAPATPSIDPIQPPVSSGSNPLEASASVGSSDTTAATSARVEKVAVFRVLTHASATSGTSRSQSVVYPADLQYNGGELVRSARVYNAFVNSDEQDFGNPNSFEEHLSYSTMMHMTDEYVGSTARNRYDWAGDISITYPAYTQLGDNDLLAILHAAAEKAGGGGYDHIYHIFLPKGTDFCGTGTVMTVGDCSASPTSPNPSFCGFHGSVVFGDIGETLFTLQPYQDTTYCGVDNVTSNPGASTPNGLQNDTQYSTLAHETFETITDPDVGLGWYDSNVGVNGEMSDLCAYIPQNVDLDGRTYRIQLVYSNAQHGCNNTTP